MTTETKERVHLDLQAVRFERRANRLRKIAYKFEAGGEPESARSCRRIARASKLVADRCHRLSAFDPVTEY